MPVAALAHPDAAQHFALRQPEGGAYLKELLGKTLGSLARAAHQDFSPDEATGRTRPLPLVTTVTRMSLRNSFAVSRNLPCSTATLITQRLRGGPRIRPVALFSKTRTRRRISHGDLRLRLAKGARKGNASPLHARPSQAGCAAGRRPPPPGGGGGPPPVRRGA